MTQLNSYSVINTDNKMITRGDIGRRIWIYQIIKRTTDSTDNNTYTELFRCYRVGIKNQNRDRTANEYCLSAEISKLSTDIIKTVEREER